MTQEEAIYARSIEKMRKINASYAETLASPRTTADLSARERSDLMDRTVRQVRDLTAANNALNAKLETLARVTDEQLDREHQYNSLTGDLGQRVSGIEFDHELLGESFLARLRWLITGR